MNYSAAIIDDERLSRLTLRKDLEKFPEIIVTGEASGIKTAKKLIESTSPDLLFLDIQLNDGNGFDLLNQMEYTGKVIFTTAYDEFAIRAFEINAVDYLLKPISINRLKNAIEKLFDTNSDENIITTPELNYNDRIMIIHKKSVNFIKLNSIICFIASGEYSYAYTDDGKEYFTSKGIGEWENKLPNDNFCRIHRSSIINFDYILNIEHNMSGSAEVYLQGFDKQLTISRNYFKRLKNKYGI